jgi:hypothetical protein
MLQPAHTNAFATPGTRVRMSLALRVRQGRLSRTLDPEPVWSVQPARSLLTRQL